MKGNRLVVWQATIDHYDKQLVTDIVQGFPITGWIGDSQIFPREHRPPSMSIDALHSEQNPWGETQKELEEGWMEIDNSSGFGAAWAMRFGLQQR